MSMFHQNNFVPRQTTLPHTCQKLAPEGVVSDPFFMLEWNYGTGWHSQFEPFRLLSFKRALKAFLLRKYFMQWLYSYCIPICFPWLRCVYFVSVCLGEWVNVLMRLLLFYTFLLSIVFHIHGLVMQRAESLTTCW